MANKTILLMLGAFALLVGCSDSLEDQAARLEKFVKANRYGSSRDQWLIKHNAFGDWEKVTLVFGYMDDREACDEIVQLYIQKYPLAKYRCEAAN